jgi:hypothetical protein
MVNAIYANQESGVLKVLDHFILSIAGDDTKKEVLLRFFQRYQYYTPSALLSMIIGQVGFMVSIL